MNYPTGISDLNAESLQSRSLTPNLAFTALTLSLCALILAPTLSYRIGVDQGVFAYMGAEILEGRLPYLQTWESDFPGMMFLHAIEILLFGKAIYMFRLFDCLFQLGNAYLIYRIGYRVGSHRAAALFGAVLFCLIYQGYGTWDTAQREGFGLFFILLGFWLYLTAERRRAVVTAMGIGLGFGLAVLIKPTLLALAGFYALLLFELRDRKSWPALTAALAGFITPIAAVLTLYSIKGGLHELYEACIVYQSIYTARLRGDLSVWSYWLSKLQQLGRNAVGVAVAGGPFLLWGNARRERLMLYLAYLGSIYAVFVQGTYAGYHYLPGMAIGAILIGSMFTQVTSLVFGNRFVRLVRRKVTLQGMAAFGIIIIAVPIYVKPKSITDFLSLRFLNRPAPLEYRNSTVFDFTEDFDLAEYLRANTEPHERIQIWGYESLVYYLADRNAASRFQMTTPLVLRIPKQGITPMQQRWRQEFMNDVRQYQPKYIAVVRNDNWWWAPEERTSEELLDDFPQWNTFIQDKYELDHAIGRFLVYRRTHGYQG